MILIPLGGIYINVFSNFQAKEGDVSKKQKSFFKFTMIIPWIVMICIVFSLQMQCEYGGQEKTELPPLTPEDIIKLETEFDDYLQDDLFKYLKSFFDDGAFVKMAEKLGDKITLYDPKGNKIIGKESASFWEDQKDKGVTDVDFTVVYLQVFPIADPDEQPNLDDTIIATGHAIFVYRLIKNSGEGTAVTNDSGSGSYDAPHPHRCVW